MNAGTITGGSGGAGFSGPGLFGIGGGLGVGLKSGYVENSGTISGGAGGAYGGDGAFDDATYNYRNTFAALVNDGLIQGGIGSVDIGVGVFLDGGNLDNNGTVTGGVVGYGQSTVINDGFIQGTIMNTVTGEGPDAVYFSRGYGLLVVDVGATFVGGAHGTLATLQLAQGPEQGSGTLNMVGSFSGFSTIDFDSGAAWELRGDAAELAGGEVITGFDAQDTLTLEGFSATSSVFAPGTGLILSDGMTTETLDIVGDFSTSSFIVTDFTFETFIELCYLRGTRIATPAGEVAVEGLGIGDAVITRFGGYRRIKWIGLQSFGRRFIQNQREQIPVRIHAGALGPNLPKRDLFVSPAHSRLLGDVLVLARNLVNGVTITQDACSDEVHYYQLEFETHDCVLAEGVWSESFCDYAGLHNQFHNFAEFHRLYPAHVTPGEHLMCAPRPEAGLALAAALAPVVARAGVGRQAGKLQGWIDDVDTRGNITGWAQDGAQPELPVLLEVLLGDRMLGTVLACDYRADLAAAKIAAGRCGFSFEAGFVSKTALPKLTVRRQSDAAELHMAPHCQASVPGRHRKPA